MAGAVLGKTACFFLGGGGKKKKRKKNERVERSLSDFFQSYLQPEEEKKKNFKKFKQ